jgi:hypothetical protein
LRSSEEMPPSTEELSTFPPTATYAFTG